LGSKLARISRQSRNASRKAGDVGDKTDKVIMDGAVEVTLEYSGVETGGGGISLGSSMREKAS